MKIEISMRKIKNFIEKTQKNFIEENQIFYC